MPAVQKPRRKTFNAEQWQPAGKAIVASREKQRHVSLDSGSAGNSEVSDGPESSEAYWQGHGNPCRDAETGLDVSCSGDSGGPPDSLHKVVDVLVIVRPRLPAVLVLQKTAQVPQVQFSHKDVDAPVVALGQPRRPQFRRRRKLSRYRSCSKAQSRQHPCCGAEADSHGFERHDYFRGTEGVRHRQAVCRSFHRL